MRVEHLSGGPPELQRKIVTVRPDGETFVLDAVTREYWGFRAAAGGAVSVTRTPQRHSLNQTSLIGYSLNHDSSGARPLR